MKQALGRAYSAAIQGAVEKLGLRIDALLPGAMDLAIKNGTDVPKAVSALNGRLVNEVIIISAQLTDHEAEVRLAAIEKEAAAIERQVAGHDPKGAVRILSGVQATALVGNWNRAFQVYDEMVLRLGRLPASAAVSASTQDVVAALQVLDTDVLWTKDAFEQLQDLADSRDDVELDGSTFARMTGWLSEALTADNRLKRLEGAFEGKPARAIPSVSSMSPWLSIIGVTAGLGGIGMVFWMSVKD